MKDIRPRGIAALLGVLIAVGTIVLCSPGFGGWLVGLNTFVVFCLFYRVVGIS